jgi:lysophospholipase L1-like esterase
MAPWNAVKPSEEIVTVKPRAQSDGPFELHDGDRVVLLGNTFIEREQRYGFVEFALTRRYPDRNVVFRNLGWSGDTVFGQARARFGTVSEGFEQLETQVHVVEPTVILVSYGSNAAFEGPDGLDTFIVGYEKLLNVLEATGARITLVSPMKHENLGDPLPDQTDYNNNLRFYRYAIQLLAERRALGFIDLSDAFDGRKSGPEFLTDNGIHLTKAGYRYAAEAIEKKLNIQPLEPSIVIDAEKSSAMATAATVSDLVASNGNVRFLAVLAHLPFPAVTDGASTSFRLRIDGLPTGDYSVFSDGEQILSATAKEFATGVAVAAGPDQMQAESLRQTIHRKNQLFFYRWRPQNETYLFLFRKHEQGNNAIEIPKFDPLVAEQEAEIARLRVPIVHRHEVKRN